MSLHVVSFAIPYPANYGGAIDVFYKIKALSELGIKIKLHAFEYDRGPAKELEHYCEKVYYYPREKKKSKLLSEIPFIVITRADEQLLNNLKLDQDPILFDGLHTTYFAHHPDLKNRFKMLRSHNIEHDYYMGLADVERNLIKKGFFNLESKKLLEYEKNSIQLFDAILAISEKDKEYFSDKHPNVLMVSAFHTNEKVELPQGNGAFYFYHGSLDVGENNEAALFLIQKVFAGRIEKLVIAGKNPGQELVALCDRYDNIELKSNVDHQEILRLMKNAIANVLPTFQATGIKLKLLLALYQGRVALVNEPMIENTGLEDLCLVAKTGQEFNDLIDQLSDHQWNKEEEEAKRTKVLNSRFGNQINAQKIIDLLKSNAQA